MKWPVIITLHNYFKADSSLYWFLSVSAFFCSRIYINSTKTLINEETLSRNFHETNHRYRDFVDSLLEMKKKRKLFLDDLHDKNPDILNKYGNLFNKQCREARKAMENITHDRKCYISIKLLEEHDNENYRLRHVRSYPNDLNTSHLNGVLIPKKATTKPTNLFEIIVKNLDKKMNLDKEIKVCVIANDVKNNDNYSYNYNHLNKNIRSTIIIPITINSSVIGFFCFNSYKIGMLRTKHMDFLAGYCDNIANLARCITFYKEGACML